MSYPPAISEDEKKMLHLLKNREASDPIEWSLYKMSADLPPSLFIAGIAHLVAGRLIGTVQERQGILKTLFGKEPNQYVFITQLGKSYLEAFGHTTSVEDAREAALNETPEDRRNTIEEAVRVFDDGFSKEPIYSIEKRREATSRLDDDIKREIEIAALEREKMWDEYEVKFGHKGAASSEEEADFRDPVIKITTVRIFRAMDEQLKRLNLPTSRKPGAWDTHYKSGDVGLKPAPWEATT